MPVGLGRWIPLGAFGAAMLFAAASSLSVAIRTIPPTKQLGDILFGKMQLPGGKPRVLRQQKEGDGLVITLVSDVYLHAVHIREAYACTDNYFDLLPGQEKRVTVKGAGDEAPTWFAVR